jgi:hypothetical protein
MGLTVKKVDKLLRRGDTGRHLDERGLYLVVGGPAAAHWELRYQLNHRARWMGLGSARDFSLEEARERARCARQKLADGDDPLTLRRAERAQRAAEAMKVITFGEAAETYFSKYSGSWSLKHATQWMQSVLGRTPRGKASRQDHCRVLRPLAVRDIDTATVIKVLDPIWASLPETASRVRGRIESVLAWATVRGYRNGDNPARWQGHLKAALPERAKDAKPVHYAALPRRGPYPPSV